MVSTFPLSCREHSFVSCIPFPIHLFLSCPSWTGKNSCYSLHWGGRGLSVHLKNPLPPPPRFTWLVKQQSLKKRRRKRRCILSLPLAVSQCVSCGLFLMTGSKKKNNKRGRTGSLPPLAARTQAQSLAHSHTYYCSRVWDFHREVFNLHWGLASHTAQPKPPTYSHAPFLSCSNTLLPLLNSESNTNSLPHRLAVK